MAAFRTQATVPAPLADVWDLMVQANRMPEWNTELAEVLDVSGNTDRIGGGYRQVWKLLGRRIESKHPWLVTAVEPYRSREFRGRLPIGVEAVGRDRLEAVADGTLVTVEIEYATPWGVLGTLIDPIMRAMLRRTMAANARELTAILRREGRAA
jgi:uncharacterized protein YndB with AHSA1/START domain